MKEPAPETNEGTDGETNRETDPDREARASERESSVATQARLTVIRGGRPARAGTPRKRGSDREDDKGDEPRMTEAAKDPARHDAPPEAARSTRSAASLRARLRRKALLQRLALWAFGGFAVLAAVVAAVLPQAAGPGGIVLLSGIAAAGMLLLFAMAWGETVGERLGPGDNRDEDPSHAAKVAASAFEALSEPALVADRSGAPRFANASYRQLAAECGARGDSVRPPGFDRVFGVHPGVSAAIYRLSRAAARRERLVERLAAAPFGPDGTPRAFDLEVAPMSGGDTLWLARDRIADGGERASLEEPMLDQAPIGFFAAAPDGQILFMNATLKSWLGIEGGITNLSVKDFIVGDAIRALGKARRPGAPPSRSEVVMKARDGIETTAVIVSTWPMGEARPSCRSVVFGLTGAGTPAGVAQALAAPRAGELGSMLDAMFAAAPFGVARLEGPDLLHAVIADANPALLDLTFGAAAPGKAFADLFKLDDSARTALEDAPADSSAPLELELMERRGERRASEQKVANQDERRIVHVYVAPDRGGKKSAYLIDVSTQKRFERRFVEAQKMRAVGDLAGGVAHDINNFLTAIRLNADSLLEAHPVGDPSYRPLQAINASVARGAGLVRMLLAFARGQTMQAEVCDLSASLSDFATLLRHFLEERVKLEVVHGRDMPFVKVDMGQLEAALLNLATNARDAMKAQGGGVLSLRTTTDTHEALVAGGIEEAHEGDYAVIEVADTGCGMSPETLAKIFRPFFTTKKVGEGTGLGLAMVHGIVKQSGGHILVDSEAGKGTRFRIFLPAYTPTPKERAAMHAEQDRALVDKRPRDLAGGGRILFVEDEAEVRMLTANILRRRGYEVIEANDGEQALGILQERPGDFDLLVSDVMMPEMDGPTLLRRGREYLGDAKVIFVSGFAKEQFSELLSNEREVSFLAKPYTTKQLAERVKEALG
jgi:two-component system cell cycle sensor histidine kinase/response regulator CckA